MSVLLLIVVLGAIWFGAAWLLSHARAEPLREGLSGAGVLLTLAVVLAGVYWYIDQRPDAAKLGMDVEAAAIPLPAGKLLVTAHVTLANVGASALTFEHEVLNLFIQRVTPLAAPLAAQLMPTDGSLPKIEAGDNWDLVRSGKSPLDGFVIEAGEIEHLYFRTVIDCQPNLRFYFSARLHKERRGQDNFRFLRRGAPDILWARQTLVDASEACGRKGKQK